MTTICAWCMTDAQRTLEAFLAAIGWKTSHGICAACAKKMDEAYARHAEGRV